MWFVFLAVGLATLVFGGLYVRRRIAGALTTLGVGRRAVRAVRWALGWLWFGYPAITLIAIAVTLLAGRATLPQADGALATWLVVYPFFWALLVLIQALPLVLLIDAVGLVTRLVRRRAEPPRPQVGERAARWRALAVLVVVVGFAGYTPIRIVAEHEALRVRHHAVGPASAATHAPWRIAFVADIQQAAHTASLADRVVTLVNASAPDVVLSGGDWINSGPDYITAAAATAAALRSRLGTLSVRGDHEHFAYVDQRRSVAEVERAMAARGVAMVTDEVRWFEHHGKRIAVVFLGYNYIRRTPDPVIARLVGEVAGADYSIVVTHQLDRHLMDMLRDRVDLVLGAHTHGGQINPVLGLGHVQLARLETEYVDGRYQVGTTTVIVTAGVGYSLVPFRYASPASIEVLELRL
jgi:uncharacterized protein